MFALLIVIVAAAGAFFWWRMQSAGSPQSNRGHKRSPALKTPVRQTAIQRFASVELRCSKTACAAAQGLKGRAILATEAPVLPLAGCDAESCQCGYDKADDRRQEPRRTSDHGIQAIIFAGDENRTENDRRAS